MTNNDKTKLIVKAVEEADLLFIDKALVRPFDCDGVCVWYQDLQSEEKFWSDINDLTEVTSYEDGV